MNIINVAQIIEKTKVMNEKVTLLGIGPMSKTVVDAAIESAIENDFPLFFIASRNQVDLDKFGSGYVESWNQYSFNGFIERRVKDIGFNGLLFKCRDHGGPWLRDEEFSNKISTKESMGNAFYSYQNDINAGFDILHIDTSKDPNYAQMVPFNIAVNRAIDLMKRVEKYRTMYFKKLLYYEISLEETSYNCSQISEFSKFIELILDQIKLNKLPKPVFLVGNTGTLTRMDKNIGIFNPEIVIELKKITDRHNIILKEHNADYLDTQCLKKHPELGIGMANVAPEFGKLETEALINLSKLEESFFEQNDIKRFEKSNFIPIIFSNLIKSSRWRKWFPTNNCTSDLLDNPESKEIVILACGHYFYSKDELVKARAVLFDNIRRFNIYKDPENYVKDNIKKGIKRYVDAFNLKNLTSKILEYEKVNQYKSIKG